MIAGRTSPQTGSKSQHAPTGLHLGPTAHRQRREGTSDGNACRNTDSRRGLRHMERVTTGAVNGSFPLTSHGSISDRQRPDRVPRCLGGTPGVANSGTCQAGLGRPAWARRPDDGRPVHTHPTTARRQLRLRSPAGAVLPSIHVNLTPGSRDRHRQASPTPAGLFCPSQAELRGLRLGRAACRGQLPICPGLGNDAAADRLIRRGGAAPRSLELLPRQARNDPVDPRARLFCIPSVGARSLGFLINGAANLPAGSGHALPGTIELSTRIFSRKRRSTTDPPGRLLRGSFFVTMLRVSNG
jgi:hypothetical protein